MATTEPERAGAAAEELTDAERLDFAILRDRPSMTALEIASETGVTPDQARRLWRALGFPEVVGEVAFTRADAEAVAAVTAIVDSGVIDFDTAVDLTRAVGQTLARLADWEVGTLTSTVEALERGDQATGSRTRTAMRLVESVEPGFEDLLIYAWRRHLAAAVARVEALGAKEDDLHTTSVTVGFADLVSFTALSNVIDRDRIGDLVQVFETRCHDVVSRLGGRIIKSLGDSVLFVSNDAVAALEMAEGVINVIGRDPKMPDVRVGLASGAVVTRLGDVFGPPVNLAARFTAVARRNRVVIDQNTASLLPEQEFESRRLPAREVHGFGLVEPVVVRRR